MHDNLGELSEMEFTGHFLRDLAEQWYQFVYPEMTKKVPADLIRQMTLVSLDDAAELQEWFEL